MNSGQINIFQLLIIDDIHRKESYGKKKLCTHNHGTIVFCQNASRQHCFKNSVYTEDMVVWQSCSPFGCTCIPVDR